MTLADKRKVIESLLCAADDANNSSLRNAELAVGCSPSASAEATAESYHGDPVSKKLRVSQRYARQAYRLIESSPSLRREWFGAP